MAPKLFNDLKCEFVLTIVIGEIFKGEGVII
jgi:hypothetical protein